MIDPYSQAAETLADPRVDVADFGDVLLEILPGDGVSVSTLGRLLSSQTLSATDSIVARIDELQFDLGEGPCWDAMSSAAPVLLRDIDAEAGDRWPAFLEALSTDPISSLFAFPIAFGPLRLGAIDTYGVETTTLSRADTDGMLSLGPTLGRRVLEHALARAAKDDDLEPTSGDRYSRRAIAQATGVVLAQIGGQPDDAHLLIQGQAFATQRTMADVAADLLEKRLRFRRTTRGITTEVDHGE